VLQVSDLAMLDAFPRNSRPAAVARARSVAVVLTAEGR